MAQLQIMFCSTDIDLYYLTNSKYTPGLNRAYFGQQIEVICTYQLDCRQSETLTSNKGLTFSDSLPKMAFVWINPYQSK